MGETRLLASAFKIFLRPPVSRRSWVHGAASRERKEPSRGRTGTRALAAQFRLEKAFEEPLDAIETAGRVGP